jgi:hypothetical protein
MIPRGLWRELGVEEQAVRQRARFFAGFAGAMHEPPRPEARQLARLSKDEDSIRPGLEAFDEPPGLEDDDPRLDDSPDGGDRPQWMRLGAEADALRQAAIATLLVDARDGLALLIDAGRRYAEVNRPYGMFLLATAGSRRTGVRAENTRNRVVNSAAEMLARSLQMEGGATDEPLTSAQQVYLMLVLATQPELGAARELLGALREQPGQHSAVPFATSTETVADWWALATDLINEERRGHSRRAALRDRFASLSLPHGREIERSKMDTYHWRTLSSSVDVVNLDLACAICIANRRLTAELAPFSREEFGDVPPLARISLQVGVEMSGPDDEEPFRVPVERPLAR